MDKIRVLVVDDSAIVRDVLSTKLAALPDIEVVGVAPDPFIARDRILQLKPDVITLDIEMPRMDGLTFLGRLMAYYPMPVIIVSSVTTSDRVAAIKALEIGAFDVVNKPGGALSVADVVEDIAYKIRQAYEVRDTYVARRIAFNARVGIEGRKPGLGPKRGPQALGSVRTTDLLFCLGASTGGTLALEYIIQRLPRDFPPALVVQHMPPNFTKQFAERLDSISEIAVKEAEDGELVAPGCVYLAPGGYHLVLDRRGAGLYAKLTTTERVHFQRPAVDELFLSAAREAGKNVVAALLTGMGRDGAKGMLELRKAGATTIAQDEQSSIVWGMPQAAVELGAACEVQPLERIATRLVELSLDPGERPATRG